MEIKKLHQLFLQSSGVCTDSRKIWKGCLFFALKGDNFDGNEYARQAIDMGAGYAVVDGSLDPHDKLVQVGDALATLQQLATFHRKYLGIPVIALTGSNGKTTTKELLKAVLSKKMKAIATLGNLNNHIGVPLTLLSMDRETEMGIVEMGANHAGEIAFLCEIAQPDYGYITNFGKAHLEGFGGIEGVIKAKSELYDFLRNHGKTIFVNKDDALQIKQSAGSNVYSIGKESSADCTVIFVEANPFVEVLFDATSIKSQLIGKYNAMNISAAIGMGNYFGVETNEIKNAIERYLPENNRSQIIEQHGNRIILDAYNANPTSMAAALESFDVLRAKTKILVLGDMFEVGEQALCEHQAIVNAMEAYGFDQVYLCGKNFYNTTGGSNKIHRYESFDALKNELKNIKFTDAHLLIKGSRGMALERILDVL